MTLLPQEIIRNKREGRVLSDEEITMFVRGLTDDSVTEGQVGAFAMAVYFQGMNTEECVALTRAMTNSGTTLQWDLPGPVLDKHSTGGVGDTVSLMLAPIVAACGGYVPMISGRGLGHTGGTYDKVEAIPGYVATPTMAAFRAAVSEVGCAVIGQTSDLAPADKRLYGVRDVTATVESIALITASILSKKLAAGLDGLVMDVKVGNGAFMAGRNDGPPFEPKAVLVRRDDKGRASLVRLRRERRARLAAAGASARRLRACADRIWRRRFVAPSVRPRSSVMLDETHIRRSGGRYRRAIVLVPQSSEEGGCNVLRLRRWTRRPAPSRPACRSLGALTRPRNLLTRGNLSAVSLHSHAQRVLGVESAFPGKCDNTGEECAERRCVTITGSKRIK